MRCASGVQSGPWAGPAPSEPVGSGITIQRGAVEPRACLIRAGKSFVDRRRVRHAIGRRREVLDQRPDGLRDEIRVRRENPLPDVGRTRRQPRHLPERPAGRDKRVGRARLGGRVHQGDREELWQVTQIRHRPIVRRRIEVQGPRPEADHEPVQFSNGRRFFRGVHEEPGPGLEQVRPRGAKTASFGSGHRVAADEIRQSRAIRGFEDFALRGSDVRDDTWQLGLRGGVDELDQFGDRCREHHEVGIGKLGH